MPQLSARSTAPGCSQHHPRLPWHRTTPPARRHALPAPTASAPCHDPTDAPAMLRSGLSYDLSSGRFNMIEGASAARTALAAPPQLPPPPASPARALVAQPDLCPSRIALCLAADHRSSRFPARVPWTGRSDGPEKAVPHLMPEERQCAALLLPMRHITAYVARVRTADPPSPCRRSRTPRVTLPCLFGAQVARF